MLELRWLFANLLQSPRSAGWFSGTTHFYGALHNDVSNYEKAAYAVVEKPLEYSGCQKCVPIYEDAVKDV